MTGRSEGNTMEEMAVTRLWMGGVIAVMLAFAAFAVVGMRRSRKR